MNDPQPLSAERGTDSLRRLGGPSEYETKLQEWKERHGVGYMRDTNQGELLMAAEESQAKGKSWCFECEKEMPTRELKLITRSVDAYVQYDGGETDYIDDDCRVRMCPPCYDAHYGQRPSSATTGRQ